MIALSAWLWAQQEEEEESPSPSPSSEVRSRASSKRSLISCSSTSSSSTSSSSSSLMVPSEGTLTLPPRLASLSSSMVSLRVSSCLNSSLSIPTKDMSSPRRKSSFPWSPEPSSSGDSDGNLSSVITEDLSLSAPMPSSSSEQEADEEEVFFGPESSWFCENGAGGGGTDSTRLFPPPELSCPKLK